MKNKNNILKKRWLFFSYLLTALCALVFIYYISAHRGQFTALFKVHYRYFIIVALLVLPFKAITGLRFKIMTDFFGLRLKLREWFGLSCITTMANYILPAKTGLLTQALYLKNIHKFNYSSFVAYLGSLAVFTVAVNSFSGIFFLAVYYFIKGSFFILPFLIFLAGLILSVAVIFMLPRLLKLKIKWQLLRKITDGLKFLKSGRAVLLRLLCIQVADISITGLRIFFCYKAIGIDIGIAPALVVGLFASSSGH